MTDLLTDEELTLDITDFASQVLRVRVIGSLSLHLSKNVATSIP